ncbi:tetratricopeptide repeat protein [Alkalinema pantanalense CENA528]|uniref:CHAT domain-containing protein n=1 Tax=Alkalinema pantanalense TaxID=1620705 RepID=UPI003D6FC570
MVRKLANNTQGVILGILLTTIVPGVAIGPVPVAIAQTNPAAQKAEAERLLQQGIQQYQTSQFEAALQSWQQALTLYRSINDRKGEGNSLGNLGLVYDVLGNYSKAIEYHNQSLVIAKEIEDRLGEGKSLGNLGLVYDALGNYPKAITYYEQSLAIKRALKDRLGEGNSLGNLGLAYDALGNYPKAIEYHEQSLAIAREIADRQGEGSSLGNLGNTYYALGNYSKAIQYHEQHLAIAQTIADRRGESQSLGNLGLIYDALGHYPKAIQYHEQSLAIKRELQDRLGESNSLGNLGLVYDALGNYSKAIEYHEQSLAIKQEIRDRLGEGQSLGNLGSAYYVLGNYPKAITYYEQSLAIKQEIQDRPGEGSSLGNLGLAYDALGNYPKAIAYHEQSLAIAREIKNRLGEGNALGNLGLTYYALGNYPKTIEYHEQSLAIAREIQDRQGEGSSLGNLGLAYNVLGNYPKAIEYHEQSLAIAREIQDRLGESQSLNNLGLMLLKLNRLAEAESTLQTAIAVQESLRTGLTDRNKISIADTQKNAYRLLQQVLIAQKQPEAALEIAERGRARALVELLASRFSNQSLADLQKTIQAPNIDAIRQIAKTQNATLVQYSIAYDNQLYIWVIKPTGEVIFRSTQLDSSQPLTQLVSNSRSDLGVRGRAGIKISQQSTPSFHTDPLAQLYQFLIAPIAQDLPSDPNQRVIFLPQGELFLVPFAALPDAQGRPLIEHHTLSTAPSIQSLSLTQTLAQRPKTKGSAVIVGDPIMPPYKGELLQSLPAARQEAIAIGQQLNTPPLIGAQATKATVLQQMPSARLLHFATHGLLDPVQGDIPGAIALTPSGQDNGFLSAAEIFNLKLNADLVVLSACDTGRGEITGDGVVGLSRSFIAAGAPSVVVSLWAVNDQSTSEFMQEFYRQLKQQPDKAQALRQAMLATKQRHPDPSHWAAFTLVGEAK